MNHLEHNSNVEIDHSAFSFTFILEMYSVLCTSCAILMHDLYK